MGLPWYSIDASYALVLMPTTSIDNNVGFSAGATTDGDYSNLVRMVSISIGHKF